MATESLSIKRPITETIFFRLLNPITGYVWDFDDPEWTDLVSNCVDPKLEATIAANSSDGTDALHVATYDFSLVNDTTTPLDIIVLAFADEATDRYVGDHAITIISGAISDEVTTDAASRTASQTPIKTADMDGDWATAGTWSGNVVPAAGDNIVIQAGVTVTVAASLDLSQFGTLRIEGDGALNIAASQTVARVNDGWVIAVNSGTITINHGRVLSNDGTGIISSNFGVIESNNNNVISNSGEVRLNNDTIASNLGVVFDNHYGAEITNNFSSGVVWTNANSGFSEGTIGSNYGVVVSNAGTVATNAALIQANIGTITVNSTRGVVNNYGGTVTSDSGTTIEMANLSVFDAATETVTPVVSYTDGAIWVKSEANGGTAGTVNYVNGTAERPCPWADALTLSASLGIYRMHIASDETITLDDDSSYLVLLGDDWNLELGGMSIDKLIVEGAHVTGIGESAVSAPPKFSNCYLGEVTLGPCVLHNCGVGENDGTFTADTAAIAGQYIFEDCYSVATDDNVPSLDFSGVTYAQGINVRKWAGGIDFTLNSLCTLSHEVTAGGNQTVTTGGADVELNGISSSVSIELGTATSETVQIAGLTGAVTVIGSPTAAVVNVYGVASSVTETLAGATINDYTSVDIGKIGGDADSMSRLKASVDAIMTGTVIDDVGNTEATFMTDLTPENTNYYGNDEGGLVIAFVDGATNQYQTRRITGSVTSTSYTIITIEAVLDTIPLVGDAFVVLGRITELS